MEPMCLGSPGSPGSPPGAISPFLPSFLMGDRDQGSTTPLSNKSPSRLGRHLSFTTSAVSPHYVSSPPAYTSPLSGHRDVTARPEHRTTSGPPTRSLFDEPMSSRYDSPNYSHYNSTMLSSDHTSKGSRSADCWVTVFGFPPSSASAILARFTPFGKIVESRVAPRSNWCHVRYSTRAEARRALACNGRLFGDAVMIGVVPCSDPDILSECEQHQKENVMFPTHLDTSNHTHNTHPSNTSLLDASNRSNPAFKPGTPVNHAVFSATSPSNSGSGARLLGQSYRSSSHETDVTVSRNTPQKNNGMVSKAWEFLGW